VDTLLHEFGRYFMLNGLTSRLCSYLLDQVDNGLDLLLIMSRAHEQMSHAAEAVTTRLFDYQAMPGDEHGIYLRYDSPHALLAANGEHRGRGAALRRARPGERAVVHEARGGRLCLRHPLHARGTGLGGRPLP
jgi:hypothetical protein